jgi:hypothetical protein
MAPQDASISIAQGDTFKRDQNDRKGQSILRGIPFRSRENIEIWTDPRKSILAQMVRSFL